MEKTPECINAGNIHDLTHTHRQRAREGGGRVCRRKQQGKHTRWTTATQKRHDLPKISDRANWQHHKDQYFINKLHRALNSTTWHGHQYKSCAKHEPKTCLLTIPTHISTYQSCFHTLPKPGYSTDTPGFTAPSVSAQYPRLLSQNYVSFFVQFSFHVLRFVQTQHKRPERKTNNVLRGEGETGRGRTVKYLLKKLDIKLGNWRTRHKLFEKEQLYYKTDAMIAL